MSKERDQTGVNNPFYKHGMTKSTEYVAWQNMKRRCLDNSFPGYERWGGRGITVCERWLSFENFYEDMGDKPNGLTLERIDNNKGYEPSNCEWASYSQQIKNQRLRSDSSSGIKGINRHSNGGWMVRVDGEYHGHYKTLSDAKTARERLLL